MWCMKISIQFVVSTYMHALYTQYMFKACFLYLTKTKKTKKLKKIQ